MRISDWSSDVCSSDLYDGCQRASTITKAHPPLGKTALPAEPVPSCQSDPCHPARFLPDGCRQRGGKIFARAYQIAAVLAPPAENAPAAVRRTEERRRGTGWVSTCRSWWAPSHQTKKNK